jgi:hypothetical protein
MREILASDEYLLRNALTNGVRIMGDPDLVPA